MTDLANTFHQAYAFDQDIASWNTAKVKDMSSTFYNAKAFDQDLSDWDVDAVTTMSYAFFFAEKFNQDLGWCVSADTEKVDLATRSGCSKTNCGIGSCGGGGGSKKQTSAASNTVIIVVVLAVAAVLLAALYVVHKRGVAHKQPHRETSMPTVGEDDVEVAEATD